MLKATDVYDMNLVNNDIPLNFDVGKFYIIYDKEECSLQLIKILDYVYNNKDRKLESFEAVRICKFSDKGRYLEDDSCNSIITGEHIVFLKEYIIEI